MFTTTICGHALWRSRSNGPILRTNLPVHVRKFTGAPAESGHQSGILHPGWRELEESIRPKADQTFLAECERGEENTLRHYEHAFGEELPAEVRPVVERQRLTVAETLLELQSLEQVSHRR